MGKCTHNHSHSPHTCNTLSFSFYIYSLCPSRLPCLFICWFALVMVPYVACCECFVTKHGCPGICSILAQIPLGIHLEVVQLDHVVILVLNLEEESSWFLHWLHYFTGTLEGYKGSFLPPLSLPADAVGFLFFLFKTESHCVDTGHRQPQTPEVCLLLPPCTGMKGVLYHAWPCLLVLAGSTQDEMECWCAFQSLFPDS